MLSDFFKTDTKVIKLFLLAHRQKMPINLVSSQEFGLRKNAFSHRFFLRNKYRICVYFYGYDAPKIIEKKNFDENLAYNSN